MRVKEERAGNVRRRSRRLATIQRTEHGVVISKIFIGKIPTNVSIKLLKKELSSYGDIEEFSQRTDPRLGDIIEATYHNPQHANALLRDQVLHVKSCKIQVEASPTWEQPFSTCSSNPETSDSNTSLLFLNDDCLEVIFNYLDVRSQLRFSQSHTRFESVFITLICPRSLSMELSKRQTCYRQLSEWELWYLFKNAGPYINEIEANLESRFLNRGCGGISPKLNLSELMNFCPQVKRVQVTDISFFKECLISVNTNLLTEVELYKCDLIDEDVALLAQLNNLRSLGLAKCGNLKGRHLCQLKNIQRLSVFGCKMLNIQYLVAACYVMNLKFLDIRSIGVIMNFNFIANYCPELETLKLSPDDHFDLSRLITLRRTLKSLELFDMDEVYLIVYDILTKNHLEHLEILKLSGDIDFLWEIRMELAFPSLRTLWLCFRAPQCYPKQFPNIAKLKHLEELYISTSLYFDCIFLLPIVENCENLQRLILHNCYGLTNEFFIDALNALKRRAEVLGTAFKPLTVFLCKTHLLKGLITPSIYNNKYMKVVVFHKTPPMGILDDDAPFNSSVYNNYSSWFYDDEAAPDDSDAED